MRRIDILDLAVEKLAASLQTVVPEATFLSAAKIPLKEIVAQGTSPAVVGCELDTHSNSGGFFYSRIILKPKFLHVTPSCRLQKLDL